METMAFAFLWLPTAFAIGVLRDHNSMNRSSWQKIYQISNGADRNLYSFPQDTAAVGDINSAVGSSNAKLSDADINAMAAPLDGYSNVYQITSAECSDSLFIRTNDPYVDTSRSFGVTYPNTQVGLGSSYAAVSTWLGINHYGQSYGDAHATRHGIDLYQATWDTTVVDNTCCRYLIGNGGNDCYAGPSGHRCINGGRTCNDHMKYNDLVMYVYGTAAPGGGGGAAVGDPHLQNVHGERFDLMQPGNHILINIPRGERAEHALLRVQANARRMGGHCADMYFEELNVTGSWAETKQPGGYHYSVSQRNIGTQGWVAFGKIEMKVVHGHTDSGVLYLNVYVKHLGRAGFAVGGLLGEDDHADVTSPPEDCFQRIHLDRQGKDHRGLSAPASSEAAASF